jgi:ribosomal protein S27AE
MITRNPTGFCPNCKQNVLLVREGINWPLAIILLCFTAGIGTIIYLIINYSKPEDRCIHCHSQITAIPAPYAQPAQQIAQNVQNPYRFQTETQKQQKSEYTVSESVEGVKTIQLNFCPFCGESLENKDAKFCPHCGTKV